MIFKLQGCPILGNICILKKFIWNVNMSGRLYFYLVNFVILDISLTLILFSVPVFKIIQITSWASFPLFALISVSRYTELDTKHVLKNDGIDLWNCPVKWVMATKIRYLIVIKIKKELLQHAEMELLRTSGTMYLSFYCSLPWSGTHSILLCLLQYSPDRLSFW